MKVLRLEDWDGKATDVVINASMEDVCEKMKIKADLTFTSPPYGLKGDIITTVSTGFRTKVEAHVKYDSTKDEFVESDYQRWLGLILSVSHLSFWNVPAKQFDRPFGVDCTKATGHIVWCKPTTNPFPRRGVIYFHEHIWMFGDPKRVLSPMPSLWKVRVQHGSKHPASFPVELPAKAIQYCTAPGQVVFDPFGGSGTTAAVAKALGRKFITADISAEYCEWMVERISKTRLA